MATNEAVYRCKSAFAYFVNGQPHVVAAGALVGEKDLGYKANPDAFESAASYVEAKVARVEQATAAPGEVRDVKVPETKGAK